jgi:hypothetical protein
MLKRFLEQQFFCVAVQKDSREIFTRLSVVAKVSKLASSDEINGGCQPCSESSSGLSSAA